MEQIVGTDGGTGVGIDSDGGAPGGKCVASATGPVVAQTKMKPNERPARVRAGEGFERGESGGRPAREGETDARLERGVAGKDASGVATPTAVVEPSRLSELARLGVDADAEVERQRRGAGTRPGCQGGIAPVGRHDRQRNRERGYDRSAEGDEE